MTETSLFFFCFWIRSRFVFVLELGVFLMQLFPLFFPAFTIFNHTSGIWKCWQSGREVLAPHTVCVCQPCRTKTHFRRVTQTHSVQSSSSLLSNCFTAALMPLLAPCNISPLLSSSSFLSEASESSRLRKWKRLFLGGLS